MMAKSNAHKNAMLKTACPTWNDSTLHLFRVMSHIYNEKIFLIRCKQWVRTSFTYFKFQVMSVYFVFNYTFKNYSQSQSPVQCSVRGSVIHSLVTCVQASTVLWINTFKIQILWETKQQLVEWSWFHDVAALLWHWSLNDLAIIRSRRQRRCLGPSQAWRWRCYRISEIHSFIFVNIPSRGVTNENLQAIRNRCLCLCNVGLHHSIAKCSR